MSAARASRISASTSTPFTIPMAPHSSLASLATSNAVRVAKTFAAME